MLFQLQDTLNVYLFPFLIAVPVALVLFLLATRRDDAPPPDATRTAELPVAADPAPAPTVAEAAAPPRPVAAPRPHDTPQRAAETEASAPAAGPPPAAPAARPGLLLVDDSAVARAKLRKLFESAGFAVELARDGLEALELLGKRRFALMITDLEMPNMDGLELIAAVSGSLDTEDMPILAITGHDDLQAKVHECQGLYGIFKKPWNDRELLRRVETLVRVQRTAAAEPALP